MAKCEHMNFKADVRVDRILKKDGDVTPSAYTREVHIHCLTCGLPVEFVGLQCVLLSDRPTVDPSAQELRAPIKPKGLAIMPGIPGFTVRAN
jgi:hypothetical protein